MDSEAPVSGPRRRVKLRVPDLRTVVVRTYYDSLQDRLPGLAAEVAFFVLLSLPPLLLVLLGLLSYVGDLIGPAAVTDVQEGIIDAVDQVLTEETVEDVVEPAVSDLLRQGRADVLGIGLIVALWSASRAIRAFVGAVIVAYDLEDERSWWQHRLLALALTAAGVVTAVVLMPLLIVGPQFGAELADRYGLGTAFDVAWTITWLPLVAVIGLSLLTWVYHIVPPHSTKWRRDLPGAALALILWALGSFGLRVYALVFVDSNSAYSLFGAPLVILLWMYVTAFALLLGAELNAEIEKMWPSARTEPESVP